MTAQTKDSTGRTLDDRLAELADVVRKEWMDAIGPALEAARREGRAEGAERCASTFRQILTPTFRMNPAAAAETCEAIARDERIKAAALAGKEADDADK